MLRALHLLNAALRQADYPVYRRYWLLKKMPWKTGIPAAVFLHGIAIAALVVLQNLLTESSIAHRARSRLPWESRRRTVGTACCTL